MTLPSILYSARPRTRTRCVDRKGSEIGGACAPHRRPGAPPARAARASAEGYKCGNVAVAAAELSHADGSWLPTTRPPRGRQAWCRQRRRQRRAPHGVAWTGDHGHGRTPIGSPGSGHAHGPGHAHWAASPRRRVAARVLPRADAGGAAPSRRHADAHRQPWRTNASRAETGPKLRAAGACDTATRMASVSPLAAAAVACAPPTGTTPAMMAVSSPPLPMWCTATAAAPGARRTTATPGAGALRALIPATSARGRREGSLQFGSLRCLAGCRLRRSSAGRFGKGVQAVLGRRQRPRAAPAGLGERLVAGGRLVARGGGGQGACRGPSGGRTHGAAPHAGVQVLRSPSLLLLLLLREEALLVSRERLRAAARGAAQRRGIGVGQPVLLLLRRRGGGEGALRGGLGRSERGSGNALGQREGNAELTHRAAQGAATAGHKRGALLRLHLRSGRRRRAPAPRLRPGMRVGGGRSFPPPASLAALVAA